MERERWDASWLRMKQEGFAVDWSLIAGKADALISRLQLRSGERILDIACGRGLEAIELASRGFRVTGVDFSSRALEIAQELAQERQVVVDWVCADMRDLPAGPFDAVMLRDRIFGCFESHEDNRRVLDSVASALRKDGRFLFQTYTKQFAILHRLEGRYVYSPDTDTFVCSDCPHGVEPARLYSREELLEMLARCGFRAESEVTWSWPGDPPGPPFRGWRAICRLERRQNV